MKPILGHDAYDNPLREGDIVTITPVQAATGTSSTGIVAGLSTNNNVDDAVQSLRMTDGSIVYDVHCTRMESSITH